MLQGPPPPMPTEIPPRPAGHDDWVFCRRLHRWGPAAQRVMWGGKLGAEIKANVSQEAWLEWQKMEVMVINELRLNFMDPKSQDILAQHLRQFLGLDPA
jgi:Fe-S cluster biosynthesis and repair protein YggX